MADSENSTLEGPGFHEVANYPLECRERFLGQARKCLTASAGAKRHFIYPVVDEILDDYLGWLAIFGE